MADAETLKGALTQLASRTPPQTATSPASHGFKVDRDNIREPPEGIESDWALVNPKLQEAIREAVSVGKWPVYLFGDQGRGKTCAMAALYRKVNPVPSWVDLQRFIRNVQRTRTADDHRIYDFSQHGSTEGDLFRKFVESPALVLVDDVGIRAPSDSAFEVVYELVNRRGKKPAIYTSNVAPDKLHTVYDGRVASRMLAGVAIHLTGKDRRIETLKIVEV
jgi:chromosomal replication initiation ATPase DnaA